MSYNDKNLLVDAGGKLIPQLHDPTLDDFKPITGTEHGMNVNLRGESGEYVDIASALTELARILYSMKKAQGLPDASARLRVNVETGTLPAVTTVSTVSTVSTVTNVAQMGGTAMNGVPQTMFNIPIARLRSGIIVS